MPESDSMYHFGLSGSLHSPVSRVLSGIWQVGEPFRFGVVVQQAKMTHPKINPKLICSVSFARIMLFVDRLCDQLTIS